MIDSCCATFAEVQKRGKDFWAEFELYLADLLVGIVVDIALVGMLAPYARIGKQPMSRGLLGCIQHACNSLPSRFVLHDIYLTITMESHSLENIFLFPFWVWLQLGQIDRACFAG